MKNQQQRKVYRSTISRLHDVLCSAVQESSSSSSASTGGESKASGKEAAPVKPKPKPKPACKTPAKPLPELMQEDVIPSSLQTILEAQNHLSEIELSFNDNRLQGSFQKNEIPYSFWDFFPDGALTGPKGFSLSSYGTGVSTVDHFSLMRRKSHQNMWSFGLRSA